MPPDQLDKKISTSEATSEPEKKQPKQVWQIVEDIYGKGKRRELAPKLAVKFGICKTEDEYVNARKSEDKTQNIRYNEAIGRKLKSGARLESNVVKNKIENFPADKQKLIREHISEINVNYIANLEDKDFQKLSKIEEPSLFLGFLREQKERIRGLVKKSDVSTNDEMINNAVASVETMEFDARLDDFLSKAESDGYTKKVELLGQASKNAKAKIDALSKEEIEKNGGKEEMLKKLERVEIISILHDNGLDEKYKSEFDGLAISLYGIYKGEAWLEKFWNKELLSYIKDKILSTFDRVNGQSGDALDKQKDIIMNQKVMQDYMKDTAGDLTNLVEDKTKDATYKQSLKQKYPTLQTWIDGVYQASMIDQNDKKFFEEDTGMLKADIPSKDRTRLEKKSKEIQPLLKEKFATVETNLLSGWNSTIKRQAVFTCIDVLRSCMNFSISDDDQKTLLASLETVESNAVLKDGNRIIKINGNIGDKKLIVYYNLTTGTVETQKPLKKDKKEDVYYLANINGESNEVNEERCREKIPLLQLPKLSDFGQKVKDRGPEGRKELMMESENITEMEKNLATKLDRDVKADYMVDINPSYFEKVAVQNMFIQEVLINFMKFPGGQIPSVGSKDEGYFELLGMVNNAANRYTKDELKRGIETIKDMQNSKKKDIIYSPGLENTDPIKNMRNNNPEKYFFEMAFCPDVVDKPGYRDRHKENTFLKFFQCFKSPKSDSFPMIDLDMLADYQGKLGKKINMQEENNMARKRNQTFNKNMEGIETQLTAENNLEEGMDAAYDDKNLA